MRGLVIAWSFLALLVLLPMGLLVTLNGSQWDWWRYASWAGALTVVATAACYPKDDAAGHPGARRFTLAGVVSGFAAIGVSFAVMSSRYSGLYGGSLVWPDALAVIAVTGLVVIEVSMFAFAGR